MPLTVWSSARYTFPLPPGHRFPVAKYAMLRDSVIADGIVEAVSDRKALRKRSWESPRPAKYLGSDERALMAFISGRKRPANVAGK